MFSRISKRTTDNNNIQMNINMYKRPTLKQITTNKPKETHPNNQHKKIKNKVCNGENMYGISYIHLSKK